MELSTRIAKTCPTCKEEKLLDLFPNDKRRHDGKYIYCKQCVSEKGKKRYNADLDHSRQLKRAQATKHRDKNIERNQAWYQENKEKKNEQVKTYRQENPEWYRTYQKSWSDSNRTKRRESIRRYSKTEKGRRMHRHHLSLRKFRKRGAGGSHTLTEWENLKIATNYTCQHCGRSEPEIKLTRDHVIPVSKGGNSFISNIQPLCQICNSIKHDKCESY